MPEHIELTGDQVTRFLERLADLAEAGHLMAEHLAAHGTPTQRLLAANWYAIAGHPEPDDPR